LHIVFFVHVHICDVVWRDEEVISRSKLQVCAST